MSWIDGAETPEVAQQLLGQGGVPTVAIVSGGTIIRLRLDHVWVEAWVDFIPSRGAVHQEGDSWIPMDASFKRHTVLPPSGIDQVVPLDGTAASAVARMRLPAYEGGFRAAWNYSLHPDSSRIAFERHSGLVSQVWAIDNLLSFIHSGAEAVTTLRR